MITVLLVDDYPAMRQLLREVLQRHADIEVIGEAATGEEAVVRHRTLKPTVVVIDIQDIGARFYTYTTTMAYVLE